MPPKNLGQCVKENINVENYMGMKTIIGGMYTGEKYNDVENIMNKKCGNGIGGGRRGNYLALCSYALLYGHFLPVLWPDSHYITPHFDLDSDLNFYVFEMHFNEKTLQ